MSENFTVPELGRMIKNLDKKMSDSYKYLAGAVDDGFKGVHSRQDKIKRNVLENTEWRIKHSESAKAQNDKVSTLWNDRENAFHRYSDWFWRILLMLALGGWGFKEFF